MGRAILYLLISILLITFLRMVMGLILNSMKEMMNPSAPVTEGGTGGAAPGQRPTVSVNGELKRDPVCGTFVAMGSSLQKTAGGETHYFCSTECRDKYAG